MTVVEDEQKETAQEKSENQILEAANLVRFNVIDYSLEHLTQKVKSEAYYVPEYQRNFTWDRAKKTRFIESLLIGLPIPFLFFWQDDDGNFEIVDGSQRLRTLEEFVNQDLKLGEMNILSLSKGMKFRNFSISRQRKFLSQSIRGILLENDTSPSTRTEMFNRINTGGSKANDAEVRRGALPGPVTDLVIELANQNIFIEMTPISKDLVNKREREELVVRFLAYTSRYDSNSEDQLFIGYRDRPGDFIYKYLEDANRNAFKHPEAIDTLRSKFIETMNFVKNTFPNGFQKPSRAKQIPRARYEAIAIGSAIAIQTDRQLLESAPNIERWLDSEEFVTATTSDGANTKSKLQGRIKFVRDNLLGIR